MTPQSKNNINIYETLQAIETSVPYARMNADELSSLIRRFVSLATMLVTHPDTAAKFGDLSTTCIQLATDLRTAIKVSQDAGTYPDVVLPMNKYSRAMTIYVVKPYVVLRQWGHNARPSKRDSSRIHFP